MEFSFTDSQPLFKQVAEQIETAILNGSFAEGDQVPSTTEISKRYQLNPATVLKGVNLLVSKQLIEKKRGIGMFVSSGARERLREEYSKAFLNNHVSQLIEEAKNLGITSDKLIEMIEKGYE
ncbi:GntR family transcriptional regulator [Holzapfeliella sp. He02]|uniref:GntR family transcriptional regulator n=1 Tax=Holzapfeliella saturejae TaxID=3082953 RepID=A0ABU8SHY1_9LACO